uniref:G2/mitotic-specific cyclin-B2-like n=1 Tax=Phallusia mammillata TaxID=59560 RepID=A0A6F9D9B3_9ASCI|nr:G2/mitotic-specific cyclin-B2-like [Phallusia mammillata]
MATITARPNTQAVESKQGAIIKKRSAIPTTRSAFGDLDNKLPGGVKADKGGMLRQKAATNLRKPLATKQSNVPVKTRVGSKTDVPTKPTLSKAAVQKQIAPKKLLKPAITESPVAMVMGTPIKEQADCNVFAIGLNPAIENIDENDSENPQLCSEFVNDIYHYMLYLESEYPIQRHYLKDTGVKGRMRSILVDWLIQVHHRFNLLQETLYLTIAILDRFLQVHQVPRAKLQLAGVTAMLLASKYEEMYAPEVSDYVYITDKAFTQSQILSMEILILKTLDFSLGKPLPLHFLRRNSKAGQVDASQHTLAKYLMELSLVDYDMCHVAPSKLAAGSLCLSIKLLEDSEWSPTLEHYSRYSKEDLQPVVCHLAKNLKSADTNTYQHAVKSKYSNSRLMKISQIPEIKAPLVSELAEQAANHKL